MPAPRSAPMRGRAVAAALVKDGVARAARRHGWHFRFRRHAPRRVRPMGARWSGGIYRVAYRDRDGAVQVTARRGAARVRFRIAPA